MGGNKSAFCWHALALLLLLMGTKNGESQTIVISRTIDNQQFNPIYYNLHTSGNSFGGGVHHQAGIVRIGGAGRNHGIPCHAADRWEGAGG